MRTPRPLLFLLLLLPLTACSRTEKIISPAAPSIQSYAPPELVGTWVVDSGSLMTDFVAGLATFGVTADVTAIRIGSDGTGNVWLRDRLTGTKDRVQAYVLFDDDDNTLVFDFAAELTTDVTFNLALERYTYIFPLVMADGPRLRFADEEGRIANFSYRVEIPDSLDCEVLDVIERYDGVPAPQFFSDMTTFQGDLMYASGTGQLERFQLASQSIGTPFGPVSSRLPQTSQGSTFWTHCGCGGSRDAFRRSLTTLFDTVSSEDEMGGPITFRAMAYDPAADRLWLHGRPFDSQFGQFYVMNTNGEPDLIEQTLSFNRDLRALAFDGGYLWGIVTVASQSVVAIDPATAKVAQSWEIPDVDVSWSGLEFAGGSMYMIGTDLSGDGVMVRMAIPSVLPTDSTMGPVAGVF
jgi:hypothetical protein